MRRAGMPPVLGFAGYSGSGKTTLLMALIPRLRRRGLRLGVIKHAHHDFEIDHPGKDSYLLRHAGAERLLIASSLRSALIVERRVPAEPALPDLLESLGVDALDLVLVEGFRHERFPKLEVYRPVLGRALLCLDDDSIIAVATDGERRLPTSIPVLDLNDIDALEAFTVAHQGAASRHDMADDDD